MDLLHKYSAMIDFACVFENFCCNNKDFCIVNLFIGNYAWTVPSKCKKTTCNCTSNNIMFQLLKQAFLSVKKTSFPLTLFCCIDDFVLKEMCWFRWNNWSCDLERLFIPVQLRVSRMDSFDDGPALFTPFQTRKLGCRFLFVQFPSAQCSSDIWYHRIVTDQCEHSLEVLY